MLGLKHYLYSKCLICEWKERSTFQKQQTYQNKVYLWPMFSAHITSTSFYFVFRIFRQIEYSQRNQPKHIKHSPAREALELAHHYHALYTAAPPHSPVSISLWVFFLQNIFFLYYTLLLLISSTFMMRNILSPLFESCKKERHRFRSSGPCLIKSCDWSKINRKSSNPSQVCSPLSLTYILAINIDSLFNGAQRWNSENDLIFYATILKRCYLSFQKNIKK